MSRMVPAVAAWMRQHVPWSNTRDAWAERLGVGGAVIAVVVGVLFVRDFGAVWQVCYWGLTLSATALVLRRGWLKLFGPVLFFDLLCLSRRLRYFLIRTAYAAFLLLLIGWIWLVGTNGRPYDTSQIDSAARFANTIFEVFASVQFVLVTLLTPIYTASAIADEKERRTLEFLLATDLRNREIVLSKLLARYLNLGMLILAGLPILALMEFLGGIDPDIVLACYVATLATVASLAALGTLFSVVLRRGRDAILMTYLCVVAYFVGWGLQSAIPPAWLMFPGVTSPVTVGDLLEWYNTGNILHALRSIGYFSFRPGVVMEDVLAETLRGFLLFHGILALICISWAVLRLRAVALKETYGRTQKARLFVRLFGRPDVGSRPMVWKEVHAEPGLRFHWFGWIILLLMVVGSFVPVLYFLSDYLDGMAGWRNDAGEMLAEQMNYWGRVVGAMVGTLLLIGVAVRAAGAITGERDRQTLDSLLTSPLDSNAILFGKWLGSVLSMRRGWLWLGSIYLLTLMCGGVNLVGLVLVVAAWLVFASVVALIGLWYSTTCRNTMRATVLTLFTTVLAGCGHWALWLCCLPLLWGSREPKGIETILQFQMFALTPPITLGQLAFRSQEVAVTGSDWNPAVHLGMAVFGMLIWIIVSFVLWAMVSHRLRRATLRVDKLGPDVSIPPPGRRSRLPRPDTDILTVEEVREEK